MSESKSEAVESQGIATIRAVPACGMITLRGAPDDLSVAAARLGVAAPATLGASLKGDTALMWMSPDEALMLCPSEDVADHVEALTLAYRDRHAMALDVSDARVRFSVSGAHAREVLAKLCALDLSPEGFGPGVVRRTKLGQVAAAIWMTKSDEFELICFRSVGQYVFDLLKSAAKPGSEAHLFTHAAT